MESIVNTVFEQYQKLPTNCKPKTQFEFTILAGFVAVIDDGSDTTRYQAISVATGTKCIGHELIDEKGRNIIDSHAEILARRGLMKYLLKEVMTSLQNIDQQPLEHSCLEKISNEENTNNLRQIYKLKDSWKFHLYISDSPCGDASIYVRQDGTAAFTGAKLMGTNNTDKTICNHNQCMIREANEQVVGMVRTKAGRSDNVYKSLSMSCSDKISRWILLGLQGRLLRAIVGRVELSSVLVGADPNSTTNEQLAALQRALHDRMNNNSTLTIKQINLCIIDDPQLQFTKSKGHVTKYIEGIQPTPIEGSSDNYNNTKEEEEETIQPAKIQRLDDSTTKKSSKKVNQDKGIVTAIPCVTSIIWQHNTNTTNNNKEYEVIIGSNGLLQGMTKLDSHKEKSNINSTTNHQYKLKKKKICSDISRYSFREQYQEIFSLLNIHTTQDNKDERTYNQWKEDTIKGIYPDNSYDIQEPMSKHPIFQQWIGNKPRSSDDREETNKP